MGVGGFFGRSETSAYTKGSAETTIGAMLAYDVIVYYFPSYFGT